VRPGLDRVVGSFDADDSVLFDEGEEQYGRADIGTRCLSISVSAPGSTGRTMRFWSRAAS
jgi:hypothetical protein